MTEEISITLLYMLQSAPNFMCLIFAAYIDTANALIQFESGQIYSLVVRSLILTQTSCP